MSFTLEYFYGKTKDKYKLSLVAGKQNLNRLITWVYLLEDLQNDTFLRGGELVITTGLEAKTKDDLLCLVKKACAHRACGVILNMGMYIKEIPAELSEWCEKKQFPLFTMPWEIYISDLMQEYCNEIISEKRIQDIRREILLAVLKGEDPGEYRKETEKFQNCFLLASNQKLPVPALAEAEWKEWYFYIIREQESAEKKVSSFKRAFHEMYGKPDLHCGLSNKITCVQKLKKYCDQAYKAAGTAAILNEPFMEYKDIGLYKVALSVEDEEVFEEARALLSPIKEKELRDTLRVYLEKNRSVQETANVLFLHRNTVNYRIQKCRSLLSENFEENSLEYLLAFYLCDCQNR